MSILRKSVIIYSISAAILFLVECAFAGHSHTDEAAWNPVSAGPIVTWTAPHCGRKKLVVQPFFHYNRTRGAFDGEGRYKPFKNKDRKTQWLEQLFIQYGITDRLEIDAQGEFQENFKQENGKKAHANGFGDSYIFSRYCAIEEKEWIPHITGIFQLKVPTGKYQKADPDKLGTDLMGADSGGGSWEHGYGISLTKKMKPFVLHADFIYGFPIEAKVGGVATRYANYINYDFGIEYFLPKGFNLMFEGNGFMQGDKKAGGEPVAASDVLFLTISPGIGWSCEAIQTLFAYRRTIGGTNTDVKDSLIFTFVYTF